jgi:hypothetical protein
LTITNYNNSYLYKNSLRLCQDISKIKVTSVATGFVNAGSDLGSSNFQLLKTPNVAVLGGEQANANDLGHLWFYLEQELNMSVAILDVARMDRYNLDAYNVIIVPEGYFRFSDNMLSNFSTWVRKGGRLIILGEALSLVSGKSGFSLKNINEEDASKSTGKNVLLSDYTGDDRRELSEGTPGAIFKVKLDNSHPLAYGQSDTYFSLKTTNATFKLGETNIMKMYLKHFNSLSQAKKISDNRGTALETLEGNYNIGN